MTALFLEGFDTYGAGLPGAANMLAGVWAQVPADVGPSAPAFGPRTGTYALQCTGNPASGIYRLALAATKGRVFLSCGFACGGLPGLDFTNTVVTFCTAGNVVIATLGVQSNGTLVLTNSGGAIIATTQGPVVVSNNWHFLEMDFNQAAGSFVLRVDDATGAGTPAINASGLALGATPVGQLHVLDLLQASGRVVTWLDDLFIRDALGTVNNGFLGDRRIATLLADADTATAGWSPRYYHMLGAGILDNTPANACVSAATATSLNVGAGDFTIESFVRFQALPGGSNKAVIFGKWDETGNTRSYQLFLGSVALNGGALCFQTSTDGANGTVLQPIVYPFTPELDTWYHIAVVRASSELLLFVNGQQLGLPIADARTYFAGAAPLGLGGQVETAGGAIASTEVQGWFDETRFTVGFARYTSNFTPTTTPFPRGAGLDPQWADVALLCGFDSLIQDESGFARALTARNGAAQKTVFDGPSVGVWSTLGKAAPDDNTFAEAPFLPATSILTLSAQPAINDTVTVGTKAVATPAVYKFVAAVASAFDVLIDTTLQATLQNLFNAVNAGPGAGTKYGTGTTANLDVTASQLPAGQMLVTANTLGTAGNSVTTSVSLTHGGGWTGATLAGGSNIPGPSDFKVQRPPPLTTIISAAQITFRGFKSDAGTATVNSALVGPLGGVTSAGAHGVTLSPDYYSDIYELDPDTAAQITPATLINGKIRLNRAT